MKSFKLIIKTLVLPSLTILTALLLTHYLFAPIRFETPVVLVLFLLHLILCVRECLRQDQNTISFSNIETLQRLNKSWKVSITWLPQCLKFTTLSLLLIALARPQMETESQEEKSEGIAIQLVVDISSSMDINIDFGGEKTTRMEVAKQVIKEFVAGNETGLNGRPNDLIGVVTFARFADTICPLTLGHEALLYITDDLTVNDRPNEDGTAYGDATALAAARLKMLEYEGEDVSDQSQDVKSKIIILLTDGENNCGRHLPLETASIAKEWGIKIYTVSLGEKRDQVTQKVDNKIITISENLTATDQLLSKMAETSGGIFRTAHDYDSLQAVYNEIDTLEKSEVKSSSFSDYKDYYLYFALAALFCTLLEVLLRTTLLRRLP